MKRASTPQAQRQGRQARVRARVTGTAARPRLNVFRSATAMFVQLIDDVSSVTLASVHSKTMTTKPEIGERSGKIAVAYAMGQEIAAKAKELGVTAVVFDRAGYRYHGRVQAVADGARAGGLNF